MSSMSFVKRLPGFSFDPTDEELILHYLTKKVMSLPLPPLVIPEFDVFKSSPWDFPGHSHQQVMYFFCTNGDRPIGYTGSGYWKDTEIDEEIVVSEGNQVLGRKKTHVFYRGKSGWPISKTDWIMQEYYLAEYSSNETVKLKEGSKDGWVLCKIYREKEGIVNDFDLNIAPTPCSSDSSG